MATIPNSKTPAWWMPLIGYVQWYLIRGKTPDQIRLALRESNRYPDLTDSEWEQILARGIADARATIACRTCDTKTEVRELWQI